MKSATNKKNSASKPVATKVPTRQKNHSSPLANDPSIQIVRSGSCSSLSGNLSLTYEVGIRHAPGSSRPVVLIRLTQSTGNGFFSPEWINLEAIETIFGSLLPEHTISSTTLSPLYAGKSINTPPFLLAALVGLGLLETVDGLQRSYRKKNFSKFIAEFTKASETQPTEA